MADFTYVAINKDGKEVKGTIDAVDENRARAKLKSDGLRPVSVKQANIFTKDINIGGGKVKTRDLSILCRQFTSILNAGVTVVEALRMLADQTENKTLKKALGETRSLVEQGETLAGAMAKQSKVFPAMLVTLVEAGEESGSLEVSFDRMGKQFEKSAKLQGMIRKAMIYPIVLITVAFLVVVVMSVFVIPRFADMFTEIGSELPGITKAVVAVSDILIHQWYVIILIAVTVVVILKFYAGTESGKVVFGKIAINAPIFGKLNVKSNSAKFARTLSTLVSSGLGISQAIEITGKSMTNILYRRALEKAKAEVEQGISLSNPIRKADVFPPMVHNMLAIGEETGNIEAMLDKVADYYEEETELATQGLTAAMEPLIIVVMGVVVGILVLAMYMPIISMYGDMNAM
ncbi:MAG: type II secretion system F family protein [Lachnospiraceae bacterium]|nr:type II secretion system F family protein [Lachnospiraceae bacterium]